VSASVYNLNKPLVIGEFASVCAQGESIQQLFGHAYNSGYQVNTLKKFPLSKIDDYQMVFWDL